MLVACTSNRPRELRDEGSSAGCALKVASLTVPPTTPDTHLHQPQHELRLLSYTTILSTIFLPPFILTIPTLPFIPSPPLLYSSLLMSPCPYMIDKYCCCLLPVFRYEPGSPAGVDMTLVTVMHLKKK